jgi:hypothetical protein
MADMQDPKTSCVEISQVSVSVDAITPSDTVEGDGFETVYPQVFKKTLCGRMILRTHFQTITCELAPQHEPPCEGKGFRR